jgi:hypothetical protein
MATNFPRFMTIRRRCSVSAARISMWIGECKLRSQPDPSTPAPAAHADR